METRSIMSRQQGDVTMAQRIAGIADIDAAGAVKELFDSSNQLLGRTANLMRILAHSPHLAELVCRLSRRCASPRRAQCPTCGFGILRA